jgi:hypothetical protein
MPALPAHQLVERLLVRPDAHHDEGPDVERRGVEPGSRAGLPRRLHGPLDPLGLGSHRHREPVGQESAGGDDVRTGAEDVHGDLPAVGSVSPGHRQPGDPAAEALHVQTPPRRYVCSRPTCSSNSCADGGRIPTSSSAVSPRPTP